MRWIVIFIMLLTFSTLTFALNVKALQASETRVYFNPSYICADESFTVDIAVDNVTNLYGWQVNMTFNPNAAEIVSITEGDFLVRQPEGTSGEQRIENEEGYAVFSWATIGPYAGVNGSGTLATVQFQTMALVESVLNIDHSETYLLERVEVGGEFVPQEIPCILENGYVNVAAYCELLDNYLQLLGDFDTLNSTYYTLLYDYVVLLGNCSSILGDYDELQGQYSQLNSTYNTLQDSYNQLQLDKEAILDEAATMRNLAYGFIAFTVVLSVTSTFALLMKSKDSD